jgi:hypothetical protein
MDILQASRESYTLLGILKMEKIHSLRIVERGYLKVRPVIGLPGIGDRELDILSAFEDKAEIRKTRIRGFPFSPTS